MAATASGREMCSFNGGTLSAFCEAGCCSGSCCSSTTNLSDSVTFALIGCIAALIFIFFVIVIIYLILRRKGYCQSRPDDPSKPIVVIKKFTKKGAKGDTFGNKNDGKPSTWDQKKKDVQQDSKHTQTETNKRLPGDYVIVSKGKWPLVTKYNKVPKDKNTREISTQTGAVKNNAKANNEAKVDNTVRVLPVPEQKDLRSLMITPTAPVSTKATDNMSSSRSASFVSPEPGAPPRQAERQTTIDLLNDFTRQVMKN